MQGSRPRGSISGSRVSGLGFRDLAHLGFGAPFVCGRLIGP